MIFDLKVASAGIKYYMHFDVYAKLLYISLPNEKIVISIRPIFGKRQPSSTEDANPLNHHSYTIAAGVVGKTCIGNKVCGDGGLATNAPLVYPKVQNTDMANRSARPTLYN